MSANSSQKVSSIVDELDHKPRDLRLPNPAWAWEHLRRNPDYRKDWYANQTGRPTPIQLATGCHLIRQTRRFKDAEKWGLITFEDPNKPSATANVFWQTDLLASALRVTLEPLKDSQLRADLDQDEIILSRINTKRVVLEDVSGRLHLLMGGERFWIHLHCDHASTVNDNVRVGVRIEGMKHFQRRLDTASQLLSLYQSSGKRLSLIGRSKNSKRLADGLIAFDIVNDGGTHRDAAIGVHGYDLVKRDWGQSGSYLEDTTRRLIYRVNHLVETGYRSFLTKKNI